ncbi:hypothetical protein EVD21_00940 [Brucella abortus]|nr:hypothetical protein EVD21_00940 [Brucella abortus]
MFDILNSIGVIGRRLFLSVFFSAVQRSSFSLRHLPYSLRHLHTDRQIDDTLGPPGPIAKVPG